VLIINKELITITKKEYNQLLKDSRFLNYLDSAGVDNWEGYSIACDMRSEDEKE